jgi:hypothetical protein
VTAPPVRSDVAYRPASRLTVVPVADEAAVYDRRNNKLHRLDPIATVVWSRLDGVTTTAALSKALAQEFGAPADQVTRDVVALLERLLDEGLVVDADVDADDESTEEAGDDEEPDPAADEIRAVPVRETMCFDAVTALGWYATDSLVIAGHRLGVRFSDELSRKSVEALVPGAWGDSTGSVDANLSVRSPQDTDTGLDLGRVYAECTLVGRGRTVDALLDRVRREAAGCVLMAQGGPLVVEVSVLENADGLLVAPYAWWSQLLAHETALGEAGWQLRGRHAVLASSGEEGRIGLPTLAESGQIGFEWVGAVAAAAVVLDDTEGDLVESPATRLAAIAAVVRPARADDPSVLLAACGALAAEAELVPALDADSLFDRLRS